MKMELRNKKILLVGLGVLGGGVATANFLLAEGLPAGRHGARLTITDLRTRVELKESLHRLKLHGQKVNFVFGRHRMEDFKKNDLIVFNAGVPFNSPWVKLAIKLKKEIVNDLKLFLEHPVNKKIKYIGITGTRGKTTTATWTNYLLPKSILGGNIPGHNPLEILKKTGKSARAGGPFVLELSSFQLEFSAPNPPPHIAIITNFSNDHLNRYGTLSNYFKIKARILKNQTNRDFLILNADDPYTKKFLSLKPRACIYFFSLLPLPRNRAGIFVCENKIFFQEHGYTRKIGQTPNLPEISLVNFLRAALAARLYGSSWKNIFKRARSLPSIPFRQEEVLRNRHWTVINDSAATSPDATLAALKSFGKLPNLVLICGGTDKKLDFGELAREIARTIPLRRLFLFNGSATKKLIIELRKNGYLKNKKMAIFDSLQKIIRAVRKLKNGLVLFSPASASFEKFRNEFDRGEKFNRIVRVGFKDKK
ncbi:UDP-N-acetylmuramoylalanine--D-glutamate ligase [Candidatus Nomurabacteria bacterium RIFCSPHIGHO2_02_FULL_42_24]|uniref:UDP-N-acetylmuramoylalanine--D-glutamate ligase n=2 Tax=Candidatus Nomuraibacteriota TaxID=1752729 RepID=A0A1F6WIG1_9BACT|nr:MAG: UDP-N-acetylmuramoylalanine--D-glutamate ligase [Candidatus Nomurabacteria bacterium RIFCSPHIGHO2_02_FULL_42_24]